MSYFLTIQKPATSDFRDRGSKFFGRSFPVSSKEEVDEKLKLVKKEFHDARHHCFAYSLGQESELQFSSDDGEPGHSAGDPILGQIKRRSLTNTLVVVVRYFGGTKLGVPGLINAYKTAADECLQASGIRKVEIRFKLQFTYPYNSTPAIERLVSQFNLKYINQEFTDICIARATAPAEQERVIMDEMNMLLQRSIILNFKKLTTDVHP